MKTVRVLSLSLLVALVISAAGCKSGGPAGNQVGNSPQTAGGLINKPDGSTVQMWTADNGTRSEVRTFPEGDIEKVTRVTQPDGSQRVLVEDRNHRNAELKDPEMVQTAMDASVDSIKEAAEKAWGQAGGATQSVGDKVDAAAGKAADAAKEAGKEIANKAEAAADAAGKGLKKAGEGAKKLGEKVKNSVKQ